MRVICLLILFCSLSSYGQKFHVVVGLAKPPYVIQDTNSGYEIELITQVLNKMGKEPNFVFVPFGRTARMLNSDRVDSIMTVNSNLISNENLLSDTYIIYQNVVVTLKRNNYQLDNLDDLSKLSVAAFQNANKILGESYAQAIEKSPSYREIANQKSQTKLLFTGKVQAVVMDINIFRALSHAVGGKEDFSDIDIHYVFPESPYKMAFKDKSNIESFNQALAQYKGSEHHTQLVNKYNLKR